MGSLPFEAQSSMRKEPTQVINQYHIFMKKLALLALTLMFAVSGQSAVHFKVARSTNQMTVKKEVKHEKSRFQKGDIRSMRAQAGMLKAITEQPVGEEVNFVGSGQGLYVSGSYIYKGKFENQGVVMVRSEADPNKVYLKNLLYQSNSQYGEFWVEGTISADGTTLTIPMGQSIYYSSSYSADVVLSWGTTTIDEEAGSIVFTPDASVTEATYTIDPATGVMTLNGGQGDVTAGSYAAYCGTGLGTIWTDDNSFSGYLEWAHVLTPGQVEIPTVITEQPAGVLTTYFRSGGCISNTFGPSIGEQGGKFDVVMGEDGKAYIKNPLWFLDSYNSWVEGTYDSQTGIIQVPLGQYLYFSEEYMYGVQLKWAESAVVEGEPDEYGDPTYSFTYSMPEMEYAEFQIVGDSIKLLNSYGDIHADFPDNYVAGGLMGMYSDDESLVALEFNTVGVYANIVPAVPADPKANEWLDQGDEDGYNRFLFTLPTTDVDGNILDPECLSYSIFTDDDQLFTFPAEDYTYDLTEDITEVDYALYSNAVDFNSSFVYMYRTNAEGFDPLFNERIGIQVYYTVDSVRNASNIVYLTPEKPVEKAFYVVGAFSNWTEGTPVKFEEDADGRQLATVNVTGEAEELEFKLVYPDENADPEAQGYIWYGGIDENEVGFFYVAPEMLNYIINIYNSGANFRLPEAGKYTIELIARLRNPGLKWTPVPSDDLAIIINKVESTAIDNINSDNVVSTHYVSITGQVSDRPFNGINLEVQTMSDGSKKIVKMVK